MFFGKTPLKVDERPELFNIAMSVEVLLRGPRLFGFLGLTFRDTVPIVVGCWIVGPADPHAAGPLFLVP